MTKNSGVYDIPLPSDAVAGSHGFYLTNLDTVVNFTGFYNSWLKHHGWLYEPKYSWTDPAAGIGKSVGYTTDQVFCVVGSDPIRTVAVIVGSGDSQDHGAHAEISIIDDPGESSCP